MVYAVPSCRLPDAPTLCGQAEAKGPSKDTQRELEAIEAKLPHDKDRPDFMRRAVAALVLLKRAAQEVFTRLCQERGRSLTASILPMMLEIKVRAGHGGKSDVGLLAVRLQHGGREGQHQGRHEDEGVGPVRRAVGVGGARRRAAWAKGPGALRQRVVPVVEPCWHATFASESA